MADNPDVVLRYEKTIYSYIYSGLFEGRNINMPRKVRFRPRRKNLLRLKSTKPATLAKPVKTLNSFMKNTPKSPLLSWILCKV